MIFRTPPILLLLSAVLSMFLATPRAEGANDRLDRLLFGDFELTRHNGNRFRLRDMRSKVVLIEFGFTSCAYICLAALAKLGMAMRELRSLLAQ